MIDPVQRGARVGFERAHQIRVAGPAFVLIQQHEEERRGVTGTVVGRLRPFVEMGQLAETQLVKDTSRFFFRQVHFLLSLGLGQRAERGTRQFRLERQHLITRDQAVAPKQRHEPRANRLREPSARPACQDESEVPQCPSGRVRKGG